MYQLHTEAVLAVAYGAFLGAVAIAIEATAKQTHHQAKLYRHRGFKFIKHLDVWECPVGERLHRTETEHEARVLRYRARAEKCNSCALKQICTDSDRGREIVHSTADWVETEIGRFHRGLSVVLLVLSAFIATAVLARFHAIGDILLLTPTAMISIAAALSCARTLGIRLTMTPLSTRASTRPRGTASPWTTRDPARPRTKGPNPWESIS